MVDRDLLAAKLAELSGRIARVRSRMPFTKETLRADRDVLDIVAFNLMLAVQSCADIASHIISDESWPAARSLAESFQRLAEQHVLSAATSDSLRRAVGLRNLVAHGYAELDVDLCFRAATQGISDLEAFAREVSIWAGPV